MMSSILLVDDSPEMTELIKEMVSLLGHEVDTAESGVEGLNKVKETHPDLILLDVMMPEMDGWTFHKRLRHFSGVPVIFITTSDSAKNRAKASALGAPLLDKQTSLPKLRQTIDATLARAE